MQNFLDYIPHREPFLFVDRVIAVTEKSIQTEKRVKAEEPFFAGHFPGRPIMPGVLICEAVFQSGAILMGKLADSQADDGRIPVISRITNVKLKHAVQPGNLMEMEVKLKEVVGPAHYLTGKVKVDGKTALTVEFSAMLVTETA
ncbi:MAG TPA: 3-hydroxyacyl-ACP dehydratase FabZ [Nitrospinaceae bacterium]|jgi:3-hydroxyacyl-[acyl-carrier-protein] dehydratase|nr:3-hydroxyacyl-ACP dehydratase FabZ [Nitrospinaceae bacterium]HAK37440.1 beta-hydroxyacyl-ACP dehydratase [Nitrospina sp.]MDP6712309.1 3-hydroxyacyl-ACP dehydratase FabZ [Nitrospinaceae bacterium]MDP7056902.1 3-hydroxyacyl-ACP dehydratase FabZ [Nitrospinaceae bacterium]MDP7109177.1 3-hydroxyacyl-ACP dehydratase FabZ [Nitrospinaceae bacterium]|tara:strand:- start:3353 stop:3784 length:432 start_codon:yes stop_codon:yes gene_type:complete